VILETAAAAATALLVLANALIQLHGMLLCKPACCNSMQLQLLHSLHSSNFTSEHAQALALHIWVFSTLLYLAAPVA
jgi:hypothetical protein